MCPQKWNASARCARSAAATTPLPLSASRKRPARARKPRRELVWATASLSTDGPGRVGEQALELVERVEGAFREHVPVRREHDRVGTPRNAQRAPRLGVGLLVEELELDLRIRGDEAQGWLEGVAERAAGGREDGDRQRGLSLEALDQLEPATELRTLVLQRERGLRGDREAQLAKLPCEREHRDGKRSGGGERDAEPDSEPGIGRRVSIGQERERGKGGSEDRGPRRGRPPDPRAPAQAAAGRSAAASRDRHDDRDREEPEQPGCAQRRTGYVEGDRRGGSGFRRDRSGPEARAGRRGVDSVRAERVARPPAGTQLGRGCCKQQGREREAKETHDRQRPWRIQRKEEPE